MNREKEIMNVRVDEIIPNRFQPRLAFNQAELKELSDSIKIHGIIQPLVLRRIGDKFEIIAGERRYKAAIMAGLSTVPAIIMNIDDKESAEVAVVENLQRKDLTAIEEAQSYKKLLDMGYLTQEELAEKMGVAQPTIANKLRLLNLTEEVQQALLKNQISERHARSLLQIPDDSLQVNMLHRIIAERMTVRQTDDEISKILGRPITPVSPVVQPREEITENFNNIHTSNTMENESRKIPNIDMLLRKETNNESIEKSNLNTSVNMSNIVTSSGMTINPFQEVDTEIMNFEIPSTKPEENIKVVEEEKEQKNDLIEEYRQLNPTPHYGEIEQNYSNTKSLSGAINVARDEVRKIEQMGFSVDTEEFDFEDMYQIIIKIKKD